MNKSTQWSMAIPLKFSRALVTIANPFIMHLTLHLLSVLVTFIKTDKLHIIKLLI